MSTDPDRDPALAALWREHSTETPPPHVDAAILAAAHRAAASGSRTRSRRLAHRAWRWFMPLAAAAVIGVVVVGLRSPAPTVLDDAAPPASDMPKLEKERAQMFAAPPAPPAGVGSGDATPPAVAAAPSSAAPDQSAAAAGSGPAPSASRAARDDAAVAALSIETSIQKIRALRDLGRPDEASRELARFRAAYPDADARLPADLREWAKSVR